MVRRLGIPLAPLFPALLCPVPGPLYEVLKGYKESPVAEARRRFAPVVRALADGFLAAHEGCLRAAAGGRIDLVLPVPSTARPTGTPLGAVEGLGADTEARLAGSRWDPGALARTGAPVGHMRPSAAAFVVRREARSAVTGRRVLVLDDTYVSGARAQSAAGALRRAGARSVVVVALGRVLRPDRSAVHADHLARSRGGSPAAPFGGPCCRCVHTAARSA